MYYTISTDDKNYQSSTEKEFPTEKAARDQAELDVLQGDYEYGIDANTRQSEELFVKQWDDEGELVNVESFEVVYR